MISFMTGFARYPTLEVVAVKEDLNMLENVWVEYLMQERTARKS